MITRTTVGSRGIALDESIAELIAEVGCPPTEIHFSNSDNWLAAMLVWRERPPRPKLPEREELGEDAFLLREVL